MNKKIKLFIAGMVVVASIIGGTGVASAQTATSATCTGAILQGTLTSTGGVATTVWFEWSSNASSVNTGSGTKTATQTFTTPQSFSQAISGLSPSTTYYYRAVFSNANGSTNGTTRSFSTPQCGTTTTGNSSTTTTIGTCTSATVYGNLTSTGGATTSVWFEWGTDSGSVGTGGGSRTSTQTFNSPQSFSALLSGLNPSTTYYYRAVFSNTYGTTNGSVRSFMTASCATQTGSQPTVTTTSASSLSQSSAILNGFVSPNGFNTTAWFEWGTNNSFGNTTSNINYGTGATNFNALVSGLSQNTTYYYRAVAQSSYGTVYGSTLSFTTNGQTYYPPITNQVYVTTNSATGISQNSATLNGYVTANGSSVSTWFEWGTNYSLGNTTPAVNYWTGSTSYSNPLYNLNPNTTYYYRAVTQGTQGVVYGSVVSFTTTGQAYVPAPTYGSTPSVTTLLATELTGSTAKINGLVSAADNQPSSAWFEWGSTTNLGNKTQTISVGALPVVKHSDYITGLSFGQTYYYRIVAENASGRVYGGTTSFVSERNTVVITTIRTSPVVLRSSTTVVTNGISKESPVFLSIEGGAEMIGTGEKRTYHVKWRNESTQILKNVVLRVSFPTTMTVDSATKGSYSSADNTVVVDLDTLGVNGEGETFIFATANRILKNGELMVVTANMVYTLANGTQGDVVAYVMHRGEVVQSALGANILGSGSFIPGTLFEWLLLLILVLILVLLANSMYGRFSDRRQH